MNTAPVQIVAEPQFRMSRLQVYNWGTFNDRHDIAVARKGFLIIGPSGSGKSTLLDGITALLVPPRWVDFNAAAREGGARGVARDRTLVSYIRGAWSKQETLEGETALQFLRPGSTWSALALTFDEEGGRPAVTLAQVFWVTGTKTDSASVRRLFLVFERAFDLQELAPFAEHKFDVRKLKQSLPAAYSGDAFDAYSETFRRLLGIDSEQALRLLHKAQSAKNVGDLNTFMRNFMLEPPASFEVADNLARDFEELNAAHEQFVTADRQTKVLQPARTAFQEAERKRSARHKLDELRSATTLYVAARRKDLLRAKIHDNEVREQGLVAEASELEQRLQTERALLNALTQRYLDAGGGQLEHMRAARQRLEEERARRARKRASAEDACRALAIGLPNDPVEFERLAAHARGQAVVPPPGSAEERRRMELFQQAADLDRDIQATRRQLEVLASQRSNIDSDLLVTRRAIAEHVGADIEDLPFVGEQIDVRPEDEAWRGALERLLGGFARNMLVPDRHYAAVVTFINGQNLGVNLFYYRTVADPRRSVAAVESHNSAVRKLIVKESAHRAWLESELRARFDVPCVESPQDLIAADKGLTCEGLVKKNRRDHEKRDHRSVSDRRYWVLGSDTAPKLALFGKVLAEAEGRKRGVDETLAREATAEHRRQQARLRWQDLGNLLWEEIDVASVVTSISSTERQIRDWDETNASLKGLTAERDQKDNEVIQLVGQQGGVTREIDGLRRVRKQLAEELVALETNPALIEPSPWQVEHLTHRFGAAAGTKAVTYENLDRLAGEVTGGLSREIESLVDEIAALDKTVQVQFSKFYNEWGMVAGDLDPTLRSSEGYFAILERLERDDLPRYHQRFLRLLQDQNDHNLVNLSRTLSEAAKDIDDRMEAVNEGLSAAQYSRGTYLKLEARPSESDDVRDFKTLLKGSLSGSLQADPDAAERRFLSLKELVRKLRSPDFQTWRAKVLDVRLHRDFRAREMNAAGETVNIFDSGAGKSGGQRQKLATTCMAAALRYQLSGVDRRTPQFAPVVMDEAFDKADHEFTTLTLSVFETFGFQVIVATPMKAVTTFEPFVGGACVVSIRDERSSATDTLTVEALQQLKPGGVAISSQPPASDAGSISAAS